MPGILDLRRFKEFKALIGSKAGTTRFDQGDATDATEKTRRHSETNWPRSDDRDLNFLRTAFGQALASEYHDTANSN
jgi:hypothetical protein